MIKKSMHSEWFIHLFIQQIFIMYLLGMAFCQPLVVTVVGKLDVLFVFM